jgi:hypothetical protein
MTGKVAWRWSAIALDASRHERCPQFLGPVLFQFGVAWFWMALAAEGRALQAWRELRAQNGLASPLGFATVWAHCSEDLRESVLKATPPVPAWSLPDSRKMRGLGLGYMWAILCPYCSEFHMHSPGEGKRHAQCCAHRDGSHYLLEFAGALPLEHQDRFCAWVRADLPRLVHQPAEVDAGCALPEPTALAA